MESDYEQNIIMEDNTTEVSAKIKSQYYFCPKCKGIPKMQLVKGNNVEISCNCYDLEGFIIDEYGKLPMEELTRFQQYSISLERFMDCIAKEKTIPNCDLSSKHIPTVGEAYCTECQAW